MATENVEQPTEGYRVYVGNLSFKATEEEVKSHLSTAGGKILAVTMPLRFGRPGGYAFVDFEKEDQVATAVEKLTGSELNGRPIRLDPARSKEESAARREAAKEKREAAKAARQAETAEKGETTAVTDGEAKSGTEKKKPQKKRTPRRRQPGEDGEEGTTAAEITDASPVSAKTKPKRPTKKASKEARIDGGEETTPEKPKTERKPRQKTHEPTGELSKTGIFVANLPFDVDDAALSEIFTNLSINVKSAKVATRLRKNFKDPSAKPTRQSRGYAFVEIENPDQQKEAVEKVDGSLIGERKISVKVANEMRPVEKAEMAADGTEEKTPATAA